MDLITHLEQELSALPSHARAHLIAFARAMQSFRDKADGMRETGAETGGEGSAPNADSDL